MTSVAPHPLRAGLAQPVDEGDQAAAAEDHAEHVEPDAVRSAGGWGAW